MSEANIKLYRDLIRIKKYKGGETVASNRWEHRKDRLHIHHMQPEYSLIDLLDAPSASLPLYDHVAHHSEKSRGVGNNSIYG
jgi:hypothetical protein